MPKKLISRIDLEHIPHYNIIMVLKFPAYFTNHLQKVALDYYLCLYLNFFTSVKIYLFSRWIWFCICRTGHFLWEGICFEGI